ncbi:GntR family transcriptional regulator [Caballeronia sp. dw_276]|uniref:GntR family transcriptional regulator n=1 Tax=Caballeronia sp. dw_276 TaxID=2719795 RepID=UPI001BD5A3D4|nr:GntR family transcriptional regulator [Caballeronia sp. dw_276]
MRASVKRRTKTQQDVQPETADVAEDVSDRIRATLAKAISEGALKPGSKILEDAIADHFGVSRTVVRGALGILEHDHLLERKRNRGSFVAAPSIEQAKELFEARRTMERLILELALGRASDADCDRLNAIIDREDAIHHGTDEKAKAELSGEFHIELARISGNGVLTELLEKVVARLALVMTLYEHEHHDDCGTDHHRAILDAVREKDLKRALHLMDEHLADVEGRVRLTQDHGDRHTFEAMLASFSPQ